MLAILHHDVNPRARNEGRGTVPLRGVVCGSAGSSTLCSAWNFQAAAINVTWWGHSNTTTSMHVLTGMYCLTSLSAAMLLRLSLSSRGNLMCIITFFSASPNDNPVTTWQKRTHNDNESVSFVLHLLHWQFPIQWPSSRYRSHPSLAYCFWVCK